MKKKTNLKFWIVIVILVGALSFYIINQRSRRLSEARQYLTVEIEHGDHIAEIEASGSVKPFQSAGVPWLISGNVQNVYVENNQSVESGQILADLNAATLPQEIILASAELLEARREFNLLLESNAQYAGAAMALAEAQTDVTKKQKALRNLEFQPVTDFLLDGVYARYILAERKVADMERQYGWAESSDQMTEKRAEALQKITDARIEFSKAKVALNRALKQPDTEKLEEANAKVEVASDTLDESQMDWQRIQENGNGQDPVEIAVAQAKVRALEASVARVHLEAPFSGTITSLDIKSGDRVTAGTSSIQVDDLSRLLIDLQISEVDIHSVKVNQPARITFNTLNGKDFTGSVYSVSLAGTTTADGVFFRVTVILDRPFTGIMPGMNAAVRIQLDEARNALSVPNRAIQREEDENADAVGSYIYLLKDEQPVKVPVKVLFSTTTSSVIDSDEIHEGDRVLLELPKTQ